jgi:hypothetical protein
MLFHVASGSDGLDSKSLLPFKLILEVIPFTHELVVLFHSHCHLLHSLILLNLAFFPEDCLSPEHGREELSILPDLLQLFSDLLLELTSVFELRDVEVLIFVVFILSFS